MQIFNMLMDELLNSEEMYFECSSHIEIEDLIAFDFGLVFHLKEKIQQFQNELSSNNCEQCKI